MKNQEGQYGLELSIIVIFIQYFPAVYNNNS